MTEIERLLKETPLAPKRPELDARMERLFAQPPQRQIRFFARPMPMWQAIALCALCVMLGAFTHSVLPERKTSPPETPSVVYIIRPGTVVPADVFDPSLQRNEVKWDPSQSVVRVRVGDQDKRVQTTNSI